ncbi:beta-glucosidase BglX [Polaribacter haliotis]|uniref:beta-glucosidase n=1 Tax=Polaribacter haliotis TaxID=1888915 RepID=A0A7L8ABX0_9FLAO|nr:beta-glucosidase BglX [Polaribacter haliotis]QOD59518.1 beta-glucosidase BglX [Polaribacter haliotis]
MNNKIVRFKVLFAIICFNIFACQQNTDKVNIAEETLNQKVDSIINLMTIEEKLGQLNLIPYYEDTKEAVLQKIKEGKVGALLKSNGVKTNLKLQKAAIEETRLGIPLIFQEDVIHGYKTIAPVPLGEAASWDLEAIEKSSATAALEASAAGIQLTYAPMVDISREPRWGRIMEGAGEDPYLGAQVAKARVIGFQGNNMKSNSTLMACVKHFAGYGDALAGRDYYINDFSERKLRELYLPPFQAAIDAGVGSVMTAYTAVNGIPASSNKFLLTDLLRKEMKFKGMLITDWTTISNVVKIGVAENDTIATKMSIDAGIDVDMTSRKLVNTGKKLIERGEISIERINESVRNVLKSKYLLGLFENPYKYFDEKREKEVLLSEKVIEDVRDVARKSMVLLKNNNKLLPLKKDIKTIAVIGPLGNSKSDLMGQWYCKGDKNDVVSLVEGIQNKISASSKLVFAEGCLLGEKMDAIKNQKLLAQAIQTAIKADIIVMALGERGWQSGETRSMADINITDEQIALINSIKKLKKPIVTVVFNGRPLILTKIEKPSDAILEAWLPGTTGGNAIADVLFGDYNPSGKLPVTFPYHQGQIPIYYNYKRTQLKVKHLDVQDKPLYPFGYGLSYTDFKYSDIKLSDSTFTAKDSILATITVKNTGNYKGKEVVQMYLGDEVCSVIRPEKELKGFKIIELDEEESRDVSFTISVKDLTFIDRNYKQSFEYGKFKLFIGTSSEDVKETAFYLKE